MPLVHAPLGVIHFRGPLWGAPSSACRKREILLVACKKVEIYFSKIGFVYCMWSNLNAPGSCAPWCHPLWVPLWDALFSACMKREILLVACKKVEIYFSKIGFVYCMWSNLNAPGSCAPWCHPLWVPLWDALFLSMYEKGNAACGL